MTRIATITALALLLAVRASAQSLLTQVLTDPTTYAPAAAAGLSEHLDWRSSQPYFANGFVEANPAFTASGQPYTAAKSDAAGNWQIAKDTSVVFAQSAVNNVVERLIERKIEAHHDGKVWRMLGWTERAVFASVLGYQASVLHVEKWRQNVDNAYLLGAH